MKGTKIIVTDQPKGVFKECFVNGTPKPGTVMELDYSEDPVGGVFQWQPYGTTAASGGNGASADGDRKVVAVLTEKKHEGGLYSTAYASGDRGYLYFPLAGEELNMILENQAGTGDSFQVGDELMVDDGTGKLLSCDSDAEAQPFTALEDVSALSADAWCHVLFNGHQ